jgi:hypothetical protein
VNIKPAQTAASLRMQYGEDAAVIAVLRAAEYAAAGDIEACAHWEAVAACLEGDDPSDGQTSH